MTTKRVQLVGYLDKGGWLISEGSVATQSSKNKKTCERVLTNLSSCGILSITNEREVNKMYRIDRMRRDYERFTGAEGYAIGFHVGEDVFVAMLDRIPRRYTRVQKECSSCGGGYGLYINVKNKKAKAELMKKAVKVGTLADLQSDKYNKGVMFEKLVYEANGQEFRGKDNVRFTEGGDIVINGKEIQVKYEHARICYDKTLQKLKKGA